MLSFTETISCFAVEASKAAVLIKASIAIVSNNTGTDSGERALCFGRGLVGKDSEKSSRHFINYTLGADFYFGYEQMYYYPSESELAVDYRSGTSFYFRQIKDSDDFAAVGNDFVKSVINRNI